MTVVAYMLFILGLMVGLAGDIRFLVVAYRQGTGWFLACLLLPLAGWLFFLLYTKDTWRPVALSIAGFIIAGIGYMVGPVDFLS